jgi:hypothetical protein
VGDKSVMVSVCLHVCPSIEVLPGGALMRVWGRAPELSVPIWEFRRLLLELQGSVMGLALGEGMAFGTTFACA